MNCFHHPAVAAVGVCRACGRGLCPACLGDYPRGITCRGKCEARTAVLDRLVDRNREAARAANAAWGVQTTLTLVLGAAMLLLGAVLAVTSGWATGLLWLIFGAVFVGTGLLSRQARAKFPE
jgi:hypothetical protein